MSSLLTIQLIAVYVVSDPIYPRLETQTQTKKISQTKQTTTNKRKRQKIKQTLDYIHLLRSALNNQPKGKPK